MAWTQRSIDILGETVLFVKKGCFYEFKNYNAQCYGILSLWLISIGAVHKIQLPARADSNYLVDNVIFVSEFEQGAKDHYTCPSCWEYSPDPSWLKNHIKSHETQQETVYKVPIKIKKDTYHFRDATTSLQDSKRPKITKENIRALAPITTIVKPWNSELSSDLRRIASQQILDQANQVLLRQYPVAHNFLKEALDVELPNLPSHLWKFTPPKDIESHDATMVKIIQFLLTDFCSKCYRNPIYQPRTERTFWIDRVVPIFQVFGHHSQLLGFQWCEVSTDEQMEFIIDPDTWMRTAGTKYHDGLGYDLDFQSRLIMEGSSKSTAREDIEHTQEDTIKNLHFSIEILNSFIRRNSTASYSSLCSVVVFSIQCVCKTITLTETKLDNCNIGSYTQKEVRSSTIPVTFNNRASWVHVFELISYLHKSLLEQQSLFEKIGKGSAGLIPVDDADRGLNVLSAE
ncbi:hypothetical protein INT47_009693 [Mucor saturninus]|uniref:Uncharacterized protein n=1 Tax=Mucor saturninus TaxID=64648 RepID=A0A8H7QGS3_9FUNG|nr:hypothetical protein INT47_009693 [Mucor saturninus]